MLLNRNIKENNKNSLYHLMIGIIFLGMTGWVIAEGLKKENGIESGFQNETESKVENGAESNVS